MNRREFKANTYRVKKRKTNYRSFLDTHNLESKKFDYASAVDKKNILLKNMSFLLRLANLNESAYHNNMNLIRLLSAELFFLSNNTLDTDTIIQLDQRVSYILTNLNLVLNNDNLEQQIVEAFDFKPEEIKNYFSYHRLYSIIGATFASPFIQQPNYYHYYEYAYYLSMFLNLHYYANVETKNPDYRLLSVKLQTQQEMISAIQKVSPTFFNLFIVKTNKWISRINFKKLAKESH